MTQPAIDVLVHGNSSAYLHKEDLFCQRDATATWTQALPTNMGDDAQAAERHGREG